MSDHELFERMAHFNRERVPERVVYAKGGGDHGTLTVTRSLAKYTRAELVQKAGNSGPAFVRFSTVAGEQGPADTARDPMGERGTPATWQNMNGYSSHTYILWNEKGERFRVKWHFKTMQRERLIGTIARSMAIAPKEIQLRQRAQFTRADPDYGLGVARAVGLEKPAKR